MCSFIRFIISYITYVSICLHLHTHFSMYLFIFIFMYVIYTLCYLTHVEVFFSLHDSLPAAFPLRPRLAPSRPKPTSCLCSSSGEAQTICHLFYFGGTIKGNVKSLLCREDASFVSGLSDEATLSLSLIFFAYCVFVSPAKSVCVCGHLCLSTSVCQPVYLFFYL